MKSENHGLIVEPLVPEDFVFGSSERSLKIKFGEVPLQPNSDWRDFLPPNERQAPKFETNACVSFGTANAIEILARRIFGRVDNLSDRFIAKGSGTNPLAGNSPKDVADFIRKNWTVFESEWATLDANSSQEFYKEIPPPLKTLAFARGAEFDFGYEFINPPSTAIIKEALKYSPVGMSVAAWAANAEGKYYRPDGWIDGHWITVVAVNEHNEIVVLDHYPPFVKTMSSDFIPRYACRFFLRKKVVRDDWFAKFMRQIKKILNL